jgi:serine/threonine protein kinase
VYAVKVLHRGWEADLDATQREVSALFDVVHVNLVRYHHALLHKGRFCIVLEYCGGGSLLDAIRTRGEFSQVEVVGWMHQLASALRYLHVERHLMCVSV